MRNVLIALCGLGVVVAAWATFRDSGPGIRRSRLARGFERRAPGCGIAGSQARAADPATASCCAPGRSPDARRTGRRRCVAGDRGGAGLRATLQHSPSDYMARRMLGVVYLSQHRFAEALEEATRRRLRRDAWNYASPGRAADWLEELRFFDSHGSSDAGYARVAYARELQGDLAERCG